MVPTVPWPDAETDDGCFCGAPLSITGANCAQARDRARVYWAPGLAAFFHRSSCDTTLINTTV